MATVVASLERRKLVFDQLAAEAGEERWTAGKAGRVLLAAVGRERRHGDTRRLFGGMLCEAFELSRP